MVRVIRQGSWFVVESDGRLIGQFTHSLDAHRFAMAMLHDGLASAVVLLSGVLISEQKI